VTAWTYFPWTVASVVVPLGLGLLAFVVGRRSHRFVAWAGGLTMPLVAAGLLAQVASVGTVRLELGGWARPLGIALQADALSALMVALSSVVGVFTCIYAREYFRTRNGATTSTSTNSKASFFWPLWLLLWGSLNALFVAADVFNLYVTLELATLASVGLVFLGRGSNAPSAGFRYLIVALAGSLGYLFGVGLLYAAAGSLDLELIGANLDPGWTATVAALVMTVGLMAKAALFPLHFWLPGAHSSAPAPVSAVLSALVVKASFYLVLRLWLDVFPGITPAFLLQGLSLLGAAAVIWGSIQALRTPRLKLLVAYSTVAQIGYLFLVLPLVVGVQDRLIAVAGILTFAIAHGLAKAAAFLTAGSIERSVGHDRIADLDGVGGVLPLSMFAFGLAGVSLSGLPPTGGFAAKWLLITSAIASANWFVVAVLLVGGLLAAAYVTRVLRAALGTEAPPEATPCPSLEWPAMALAVAALTLGFFVGPMTDLLAGQVGAIVSIAQVAP